MDDGCIKMNLSYHIIEPEVVTVVNSTCQLVIPSCRTDGVITKRLKVKWPLSLIESRIPNHDHCPE